MYTYRLQHYESSYKATIKETSRLSLAIISSMKDIQNILRERIIFRSDTEIMSGAPVFVGTRIPLQTFFDYLEGESGLAEFLEDFPHLKAQVFQVLEVTTRAMLEQERNIRARFA